MKAKKIVLLIALGVLLAGFLLWAVGAALGAKTLYLQNGELTVGDQPMGGFSIVSSESNNLEISDEGATKGLALLELGRMLGLEKSQVMACGDSENDLPMLETVGLGVAMGNAPRFIQEKAAAVTATNDEDGVALALEKYVLGR